MACWDGWSGPESAVNGVCPDCGMPTVDGAAQYGCGSSPQACATCGSRPCDLSC